MTATTLTCPECGDDVWDLPHGHKLAKCWNTEGHADGGTLAFDTMSDEDDTLDMSANYSVHGFGGIAFYLLGYDTRTIEESWEYSGEGDVDEESSYFYNEPEEVEDRDYVRAVMVGDDHVHTVDVDDLTLIAREDFCGECGQIGCGHDGLDRDDS